MLALGPPRPLEGFHWHLAQSLQVGDKATGTQDRRGTPTATHRGDAGTLLPTALRPELLGTALPSCLNAVPSTCPGLRMGKGLEGHMLLTLG